MQPFIYILANRPRGILYVGVTSELAQRVWQHRSDAIDGFTGRYGIHRLVYYEAHETMTDAIARKKRIKKWRRAWKLKLIGEFNPDWRDLFEDLVG